MTKETVAEILGSMCYKFQLHFKIHIYSFNFFIFLVKNNREEGFHLDLEDFLMGLLQLSAELVPL